MKRSWKTLGLGKPTADITYQVIILVHRDRRRAYIIVWRLNSPALTLAKTNIGSFTISPDGFLAALGDR